MEQRNKKPSPDDFWDISSLIPKKKQNFGYVRSTDTVEVQAEPPQREKCDTEESSTIIKRYIPPHSGEALSAVAQSYESVATYQPEESFLHQVTLKKQKCGYRYYQEFLEDAKRYIQKKGTPCEYVPFFSYVPQYNQMNDKQLSYYLWFRECFLNNAPIRIDYSYLLLWIYERINLGTELDVLESQRILTEIWKRYHKEFPALSGKLSDWICDFSLIHRLPPPPNANSELVSKAPSLKEFYISVSDYDVGGCVRSLLKYCSSYDYHSSKFATEENLPLFDQHVFEALALAVSYYSEEGKILSKLAFEDSTLIRDAYAGALCSADAKYRLEIRYCSFSRSNELRFLIGDIVKYAENKLRTYLGIKSKMTVYSIPTELQRKLDEYFSIQLPGKKQSTPKKEVHAYDALYDLPQKSFSLRDAERIEELSWETTGKLISAFEEDSPIVFEEAPLPIASQENQELESDISLRKRLGEYWDTVLLLSKGSTNAIAELSRKIGKMADSIADEINEIAVDFFGDALIEECDGGYAVIEDYREYLNE